MASKPSLETCRHWLVKQVSELSLDTLFVAYSGGMDSSVLLHWLHQLQLPVKLEALHVHHGLQTVADEWVVHIQQQSAKLNIACQIHYAQLEPQPRTSTEALARDARYQFFSEFIRPGAALITGHHQDDQFETLMLALKRGSGVHGLAAMPRCSAFQSGYMLRPLLPLSRDELAGYAEHHQLSWVEDPTNAEQTFDRNYIRHALAPVMQKRWPSIHKTVARSAALLAQQAELVDELAELDAKTCIAHDRVDIENLQQLSDNRQRNLMQWFIRQYSQMPSQQMFERIWQEVLPARADAEPCLNWAGVQLRRYRQHLYLLKDADLQSQSSQPWHGQPLLLGSRWLRAHESVIGLRAAKKDERVSVRFNLPGATRCKPVSRNHSRELKKLWQEYHVPPWLRPVYPMLFYNEQLVAVPGLWVETGFLAENGFELSWE